jgi:hypothetical protein
MIICNHLRDGSISGINGEYICGICNAPTIVRFEGRMISAQIAENKKLVESCMCEKHYSEAHK